MNSGEKYLVVVQVVGETTDEELVRRIGNDGGDDACRDDSQQNEINVFQLGGCAQRLLTNLGRGTPAALRFPAAAGSREAV